MRKGATLVGTHDCADSKPAVLRIFFHARGYSECQLLSFRGSNVHQWIITHVKKKNLPSFAMSGFESYKGQSIYLAHPLPGRDLGDSFVIFLERALTFWCCVSESGRGRFFFGHSRLWQLAILMPVGRSAEEGHRTNEDAIRPYAGEIVDGVLFAEGSSIWRLLVQRSPVPPDWHQL